MTDTQTYQKIAMDVSLKLFLVAEFQNQVQQQMPREQVHQFVQNDDYFQWLVRAQASYKA